MNDHAIPDASASDQALVTEAPTSRATSGESASRTWAHVASRWALTVGMLACVLHAAHAGDAEKVRVENFTSFNDLGDYLEKQLSPEIKEAMRKQGLAVFAIATAYPGKKACYAGIGLTMAQPQDRNPRIPGFANAYHSAGGDKNWSASDCKSKAIESAVSDFNAIPLEESLAKVDLSFASGGSRTTAPPKDDTVLLSTIGLKDQSRLFETAHKYRFAKAFDYRQVQITVYANGTRFKDGSYMCVAFAGLSANSPEGRNARWPGFNETFVRLQTGGDVDGCKEVVATQAVDELLRKPWNAEGLLKNFEATREDGVALPDLRRVATAKVRLDTADAAALAKEKPESVRRPAAAQLVANSATSSVSRSSCQNQCMNGSCLRTLPGEGIERWQAPRRFDRLASNWGWDTTINACEI